MKKTMIKEPTPEITQQVCELRAMHVGWDHIAVITEIPLETLNNWRDFGDSLPKGVYADFVRAIKETESQTLLKYVQVVHDACLYGQTTQVMKTITNADGSQETIETSEKHPPDATLILKVLAIHYPDEWEEKRQLVLDWLASGEDEPPDELVEDFRKILLKVSQDDE